MITSRKVSIVYRLPPPVSTPHRVGRTGHSDKRNHMCRYQVQKTMSRSVFCDNVIIVPGADIDGLPQSDCSLSK